jgi:hypothetical protein
LQIVFTKVGGIGSEFRADGSAKVVAGVFDQLYGTEFRGIRHDEK